MSPTEHEELVRGIILEQRLRKRIALLQEYQREGIRTIAESLEYEAGRKKREQLLAASSSLQECVRRERKLCGFSNFGVSFEVSFVCFHHPVLSHRAASIFGDSW